LRLALAFAAFAVTAAQAAPLEDTRAFDRAFAASFYTFDACGDAKGGLLFRKALEARFAQCGFSDAARAAHKRRNASQTKMSRQRIQKMIDDTGGMPARAPGMDITCRQREAEPDYVAAREKLERFSQGTLKPNEVLPGACDADVIAP